MRLKAKIDRNENTKRTCSKCHALVKTITIYGESDEPLLTLCKGCLLSMLRDFEGERNYGPAKYIPF